MLLRLPVRTEHGWAAFGFSHAHDHQAALPGLERPIASARDHSLITPPERTSPDGQTTLVSHPLCPGAVGDRCWRDARLLLSGCRKGNEAARRRLYCADQDDDRARDLLHGGARNRLNRRHAQGWTNWCQNAVVFRDGIDRGTPDWPAGRRIAAARRGF